MSKRWILIVLGVVCAAILLAAGGAVLTSRSILPPQKAAGAIDWTGPVPDDGSLPPGNSIAVPGVEVMQFKADETRQSVNLYNPARNSCYFQISILLADGVKLYQSEWIAPGKGLYEIDLLRSVPEGRYDGSVLKYECFSMDEEHTPLNGAEFTFTIESSP